LVGTGSGNTSTTSTVTAIAGTPAYTYLWTKNSGGSSKISVIASTSATTGFSGAGLTDGETVHATFTCTVTDSTMATATVQVAVTFRRDDAFGS
jgi:hypothetical protein